MDYPLKLGRRIFLIVLEEKCPVCGLDYLMNHCNYCNNVFCLNCSKVILEETII